MIDDYHPHPVTTRLTIISASYYVVPGISLALGPKTAGNPQRIFRLASHPERFSQQG
jgi:hypothetical protein